MFRRDFGKVGLGLLAFVALAGFPFWYGAADGESDQRPELEYPPGESSCVESREFMLSSHMELLNEWRDSAVRLGQRTYTSSSNHRYDISLQNTCLDCHRNKAAFCDRCHSFAGVETACWGCHVEPKEVLSNESR